MKNLFSDDYYKFPLFIGSMFVGFGDGFYIEQIPEVSFLGWSWLHLKLFV